MQKRTQSGSFNNVSAGHMRVLKQGRLNQVGDLMHKMKVKEVNK